MRHNTSLELFAYWNRRRGGRAAPSRLQIEPADIRTLLPDVFILEPQQDGPTFRLAGTRLCALFDRELKGDLLERLWIPGGAEAVMKLASSVLDASTPGVVALCAESRAGRAVNMELVMLPLADETGRNKRILGALSALEKPYWLGLDPIVGLVTDAIRMLDVHKEHVFLASRPEIPVEPNSGALRPRQPGFGVRHVSHLTLIEGGRA